MDLMGRKIELPRLLKVRMYMMAKRTCKNIFRMLSKIFVKRFLTQIFEKSLFGPFLTKNSKELVSMQSSIDSGKRAIAHNDHSYQVIETINGIFSL